MFSVVAGSGDDVPRAGSSLRGRGGKEAGLRVDEEQLESFEKIRELFVAGGYFRAMIKTLVRYFIPLKATCGPERAQWILLDLPIPWPPNVFSHNFALYLL